MTTIKPGDNYQSEIDNSPSGADISFVGTFVNLPQLKVRGNRKYHGNGTNYSATGKLYVFGADQSGCDNAAFDGFNFLTRAFRLEVPGNSPKGWDIGYCGFAGNFYDGGSERTSIYALGLNGRIHNNLLTSFSDWGAIYGAGWNDLTIDNNHFDGVSEGMHLVGNYSPNTNLYVKNNLFTNWCRLACELQNAGASVTITGNNFHEPNWTWINSQPAGTVDNVFALSVATDGVKSVIVNHNTIYSSGSAKRANGSKSGLRIAIELGADPTVSGAIQCTQNDANVYSPQSDANLITISTSTGANVYTNRLVRYVDDTDGNKSPIPSTSGLVAVSFGTGAAISDNTPTTTLGWTPPPPFTVDKTPVGPNGAIPVPPIPPKPPEVILQLTAKVTGDSTADISFSGNSGAVILNTKSSSVGEVGPQVGPSGVDPHGNLPITSPISLMGFHPGWAITVQATDAAGNKSAAIPLRFTGNPNTSPWPPVTPPPVDNPVVSVDTVLKYKNGASKTTTTLV